MVVNIAIISSEIFDYAKNKEYLEKLCRKFPFIKADALSRTSLSRGIFSLTIGNSRNSVLYAGGFHGSEWITCLALYRFIEKLSESLMFNKPLRGINIKKAFEHLGVTVIPCVNPDGVEIAVHGSDGAGNMKRFVEVLGCEDYSVWNANAMGVDINHNFDAGWNTLRAQEAAAGIHGPAPRQFSGRFPESEAETKALTRLCRTQKFRQVMAVHSQGEELFWQYGENTPPQSDMMAKILADSCGYKLVTNEGLASHGGFKDWFINEFSRPGFTLEIGKGKNPLPVSDLDAIYERIEEALIIFALM